MNIVHVSLGLPPYRSGGLTKYSVDLMLSQQELKHEVSLLYPGHYNISRALSFKKNHDYKGIKVYEIVNPLPVPLLGGIHHPRHFTKPVNKEKYAELLRQLDPDVIHLHSLMGIHKEFLEAAKERRIRIVFTSHDYFGICPKVNLLDHTGQLCEDYGEGNKCIQCNVGGYSMMQISMMQSRVYRKFKSNFILQKLRNYKNNKGKENEPAVGLPAREDHQRGVIETARQYVGLRSYYLEMLGLVDTFHFNSRTACNIYQQYLNTKGTIIPITHRDIDDHRRLKIPNHSEKPLYLAYLGPVDRYKGFYLLEESLNRLKDRKDWHLHIYGDTAESVEQYDPAYYTFHGKYRYDELESIFNQTDMVVIPSLCKETFGFTGLEALSYGVPVMASSNVGFQDLISDGETGIIFQPNANHLKECILAILDNRKMVERMNRNIVNAKLTITMDRHTQEMIDFYQFTG